jgi:hypothetical protein
MKAYEGVEEDSPFLTSALHAGEWCSSCAGRFIPGETTPGTLWIRCWVGPKAGLEFVEKRKTLPLLGIEPRPSSP